MPPPLISNRDELAVTKQRRHALSIIEAGMKAIDTKSALRNKIKRQGNVLQIGRRKYHLDQYENIYVIGIGKSALAAATQLEKILRTKITAGIILDVQSGPLKKMTSIAGTHPHPSLPNMRATGEIMAILKNTTVNDLVICIISGGGSALLYWPLELSSSEMTRITKLLFKRGATIHELNTVRKHLSEIQGGQLARIAYPGTVIGLIFSDIPSDDLSMVASGPTFLDTTTVKDAEKILVKYNVLKTCSIEGCNLKETPKDPNIFDHVHNELVVSNKTAVKAMVDKAKHLKYKTKVYSTTIDNDAKEVGPLLASLARPKHAIIAAGETIVNVTKPGKGGRNLEVSLSALPLLKPDSLVISFASDGKDHVPVAGAIADNLTKQKATDRGLNPKHALLNNQSYRFFKQTNDLIRTGPTGRNVSDLMLVLKS